MRLLFIDAWKFFEEIEKKILFLREREREKNKAVNLVFQNL